METNMEVQNNRSLNIVLTLSVVGSVVTIVALALASSAQPPLGTIMSAFCSVWAFGNMTLGYVITGILLANAIVWTGVMAVGATNLAFDGVAKLSRMRQAALIRAARKADQPAMPVELAA